MEVGWSSQRSQRALTVRQPRGAEPGKAPARSQRERANSSVAKHSDAEANSSIDGARALLVEKLGQIDSGGGEHRTSLGRKMIPKLKLGAVGKNRCGAVCRPTIPPDAEIT